MASVDENISNAVARIDNLIGESQSYVDALREFQGTTLSFDAPGAPTINIDQGTGLEDAIKSIPVRPTGLDFVSPGNVSDPPLTDIRDADPVTIPSAPTGEPEINIPNAPVLNIPASPTAPFIDTIVTPDAPTVLLPSVPVLNSITLPQEPLISLPTFTQQFPEEELPFTATPFNFSEPEFTDELLDEIKSQELDDLVNGGFGIDPRDEEQLVGRVRDREARAGRTRETQVLRNFASRGHHLPSGALDDALRQAQFETQATISAGEREIYTTRADLFRKTREFILQNGLSTVEFLGNLFSFRQERALKAARFLSEFSVTVFDALVKRYNAQIAAYNAAAETHRILIQSELAKIEIFAQQIQAQKLIGGLNEQLIAIYTAQIGAAQAEVDIFRTQMQAASIRADIERIKIQAFGEQVNAFNSQVNAERTRIDAFVAQVRGETAKLEVFNTQSEIYRTQMSGAEIENRIQVQNVASDIERNRLALQRYNGQIEQFRSNLQREISRVDSLVKVYSTDTEVYNAFVGGWKAYYDNAARNTEVFFRTIVESRQLATAQAEIELQRQINEFQLQFTANQAGVAIYQDLVSSAQGALNTLNVKEDVNA